MRKIPQDPGSEQPVEGEPIGRVLRRSTPDDLLRLGVSAEVAAYAIVRHQAACGGSTELAAVVSPCGGVAALLCVGCFDPVLVLVPPAHFCPCAAGVVERGVPFMSVWWSLP